MSIELFLPSVLSAPVARLVAAALLAVAAIPATAQPAAGPGTAPAAATASAPASTVIAIVEVPKPWYAPRAIVVGKMRESMPQYAHVPGLAYKVFSLAREGGGYGGLYEWTDIASAQAWFSPAWFERVRTERGADARVRFYDAPVSLDNTPGGTPLDTDSHSVATLVNIPIPAGVSRDRLFAGFQAAVPEYQKLPGLLRKHFTLSDGATFGGLYLWKDEASAKAWFNPAWHERVRATYGAQARIEWFDAPIVMPMQNAGSVVQTGALAATRR